jgi:hypothetical protein
LNWFQKDIDFFIDEQKFIATSFQFLHYYIKDDVVFLVGDINIDNTINDKEISDSFRIRIQFPHNYPENYPFVYETSKKIPNNYHTNPDGTLCLGTEIETSLIFFQKKSIKNFIINLLIPYLSGFIYSNKYGELPYGERQHGIKGKFEFYYELFGTNNIEYILKLLNEIKTGNLRGHHLCPCGSNISFRKCHWNVGKKLLVIPPILISQEIKYFQNVLHPIGQM